MLYDERFFDVIRDGCVRSAQAVVPVLERWLGPMAGRRVIDVGCGEGHWGLALQAAGAEATGIDGPGTACLLERFAPHDLSVPLPLRRLGTFDLAVCLEVAEHLPYARSFGFIGDLCALAPLVVFSAAIPGQGGTGHIHEAWPSFWAARFADNGFQVSGALRWELWADDRVENWYRQNLLIAANAETAAGLPELFQHPLAEPHAVVHPVLWESRR